MANWVMVCAKGSGLALSPETASYFPVCSALFQIAAADAYASFRVRGNYTWKLLRVKVTANAHNTDTEVRSRKNGANGTQLITIGALATGIFGDAVNSDSLVDGDTANTLVAAIGGAGVMTITTISCVFQGTAPIIGAYDNLNPPLGTDQCTFFGGYLYSSILVNESMTQFLVRTAETLSNMRWYIYQNNIANATIFRLRKNGGNGSQNVTVGAGATGAFEDAVNTDALVAGDVVNYFADLSGLTNIYASNVAVKSTCPRRHLIWSNIASLSFGQTYNQPVEGYAGTTVALEAQVQIPPQFAAIFRNLFTRISANNLDGDTTIRTRKGGANGNQTITIGAGATGTFEDNVGVDNAGAADLINYQWVTLGTAGSIMAHYIAMEQGEGLAAPQGSLAGKLVATDAL